MDGMRVKVEGVSVRVRQKEAEKLGADGDAIAIEGILEFWLGFGKWWFVVVLQKRARERGGERSALSDFEG